MNDKEVARMQRQNNNELSDYSNNKPKPKKRNRETTITIKY